MRLFYRFVIFVIAVLFFLTSIVMATYCFGWTDSNMLPDIVNNMFDRWELGLIFVLFIIGSAWVIYPFFVDDKPATTPISKSNMGDVDITLDAMDSLVRNIAMEQEGIVSIKNRLKSNEDGLMIFLTANIYPSMSIPNITESLQELVKSYVEDTTGVTVAGVKVLVEQISKANEKKEKKVK